MEICCDRLRAGGNGLVEGDLSLGSPAQLEQHHAAIVMRGHKHRIQLESPAIGFQCLGMPIQIAQRVAQIAVRRCGGGLNLDGPAKTCRGLLRLAQLEQSIAQIVVGRRQAGAEVYGALEAGDRFGPLPASARFVCSGHLVHELIRRYVHMSLTDRETLAALHGMIFGAIRKKSVRRWPAEHGCASEDAYVVSEPFAIQIVPMKIK